MGIRIGIDVGGTFTDMFLWADDREVHTFKVLSTPDDPSEGVLTGLRTIADQFGLPLAEFAGNVERIVHGTTVTTNATLTRNGAPTGLVTTQGVRDALEMRRGIREEQYNNRFRNVVPLVPRHLRRTAGGRLDYAGSELEALVEADVREAAAYFRGQNITAVAICFMNAFANADHEQRARAIIAEELPDAYLTASSDLLPVIRFYNRISTTVLNAYVGPVLDSYLESLTCRLKDIGFGGVLLIMQSNGGVARPEVSSRQAAGTLLSGPAGGPRAAAAYAERHRLRNCMVVDMGGTSFDASLVQDGRAALKSEGDIDRLRIALPMLDIATIGAGGGSIGWIDEGGLLRMGPQSAGAHPGPACYDRGGQKPACTDADLVLGFLDPATFAGGKMPLRADLAKQAIERDIGGPLGFTAEEAAVGMYRVINASMAHGVREITVKRGLDPREFPMVVAGGAGALHACEIARELGMRTLIVPATASTLCATGMLLCDLQHDYLRSLVSPLAALDPQRLVGVIREMIAEGEQQLAQEGIAADRMEHRVALDLRYLKQYHEVTVPATLADLEAANLAPVAEAFHARHDQLYGYELREEGTGLELITVRVQSVGHTSRPDLPRVEQGEEDASAARIGERRAWVPERDAFDTVPVYNGHALTAGNCFDGPALIERSDTTIYVTESFQAVVDDTGSCVLTARDGQTGAAL